MTNICELPYFEIEIDRSGNLVDPQSVSNILAFLKQADATNHLFVIVHGWNSNMQDSRGMYEYFFTQFCKTLKSYAVPGITAGRSAVVGVLWPSERYTDPALIPGGAASLHSAVGTLLNLTTYYLMKDRAGIVGRGAVAPALDEIQAAYPGLRIHLAGHSFGCRVIAAAAAVTAQPVASMALFQAAFSHNSFSPDYDSSHQPGSFRDLVTARKCAGPMIITHSMRDEAVGLGYPIASAISGQNASSIGGPRDRYGALGRNGARHTPEASDGQLLAEGTPYSFAPGLLYNLRADDIIHAHGDIVKPQTAWALIAAAGLGSPGGSNRTIQSSE
jgi:pimeloyl-ACP methyl ester carboxylesterase